MHILPTRIAGVRIVRQRPEHLTEPDGGRLRSGRHLRGAAALRHRVRLVAECGFTAQPQFARRTPVRRTLCCAAGEVFVAVVDVRRGSPTFGDWQGFYFREYDGRTLRVPAGLAVGWQAVSVTSEIELGFSRTPKLADWRELPWYDTEVGLQWPQKPTGLARPAGRCRSLGDIPNHQLPRFRIRSSAQSSPIPPVQMAAGKAPDQSAGKRPIAPSRPHSANLRSARKKEPGPILVVGSSGRLGRDLVRYLRRLGPVIGACRHPDPSSLLPVPMQVDVSRPASLRAAIDTARPSLIVNATGLTDIDLAENDPRLAQLVNATAPAIMAEEAKKIGAGLLHFCSDMVFDGSGERPFRECDTPKPQNQFARTKILGTQAIESTGVNHLILRAGWLYATHGEGYVQRIVDLCTYRNTLTLPSNHYGSPTSSRWLAETVTEILSDTQRGSSETDFSTWMREHGGLYHVSMLGYASRIEVGDLIVATCKNHRLPVTLTRLQGLPLEELPRVAQIPANCKLDPTHLVKTFSLTLPRWQDELTQQISIMLEETSLRRKIA